MQPEAGSRDAAGTTTVGALQWAISAIGVVLLIAIVARRWYRLEPLRRPAAGSIVLVGGLGFVLVYLTSMLVGPIVIEALDLNAVLEQEGFAGLDLPSVAILTAAALGAQAVVAAVVLPMFFKAQRGWWPTGRAEEKPSMLQATGLAIVALFVLVPITMLAAHLATMIGSFVRDRPVDPIAHDTLRRLIEAPHDAWFMAMIALVIVAAPIIEEILYRGLLQRAIVLWSGSRWTGIMLAAAVFAGGHMGITPAEAIAPLFVLGIGFGWVYERTGRLIAPIVMHGLFNAGNVAAAIALSPA